MRKEDWRGRFRFWAVLAACMLSWCLCAARVQAGAPLCRTVGLRYAPGNGMTAGMLERVERTADGDLPKVTLWRSLSGEEVSREGGFSTEKTAVVEYRGNSAQAFPAALLCGNYPAAGDETGCAVSRALADRLWGGTDVVGGRILWNGRVFVVRGVLENSESLLLARVREEDRESVFSAAELVFSDSGSGADQTAAFLLKTGLPQPDALLDAPLLAGGGRILQMLPAWCAACFCLARLLKRVWQLRACPLYLFPVLCGAFPAGMAAVWAAQLRFSLPDWMIPPKWSDFSFWTHQMESLGTGLKNLFRMPFAERDLVLLCETAFGLFLGLLALFFMILVLERVRMSSFQEGYGSAVLAPVLIWLLLPRTGAEPFRALWLTFPVLFLCDCLLRFWDAKQACLLGPGERGERDEGTNADGAAGV